MAKQQWADCVETALTTENPFYDEPLARANLLHFHKQVEELMEAAFVIKSMKKVVRKR